MMRTVSTLLMSILMFTASFAQVKIEVDATQQGMKMSQDLIGAFFEDINYGADGGLYAELVQNRSFEYFTVNGYTNLGPLHAWTLNKNTGNASITVESTNPLNTNNTHYLKMAITDPGNGIDLWNSGFNGITLKKGAVYDFSIYIRRDNDLNEPVIVSLKNSIGVVLASATIKSVSNEWQKYNLELISSQTTETGRLVLTTTGHGNVYFDMVSLFPQQTFKNRKNGLREDLATAVADMQPKFLRFPGGCVSHGRGNDNAYRWKETIGDVAERTPNWNLWGYHQTYGLGFYEYFLYCEDIGAKPLPVLPLGISCQFRNREIVPMSELQPWADDALDLIEFANGEASSEWGAVRAKMGHPEPFNLKYLCLGNEEDDIPEFRQHFSFIADQIKAKYPEIEIIGTSGVAASGSYYNSLWAYSREEKLSAVDEHYYMDPVWFLNNNHRYDNFDRNGPKVFIGEYASKNDLMSNAIAEAAYLTGVERNSDVIQFTCYAPLFCNEDNNQWHPDLIRFNNSTVVKTASYYVQQLYSTNAGDEYLPSTITYDAGFEFDQSSYQGKIGVGTWNTQAQFDHIKITAGDQVLAEEGFNSGAGNWQVISGTFNTSGAVYNQSSDSEPAVSIFNYAIEATDYTVSLSAKKTGGNEGFLIPFAYKNSNNYYWLNIGGWANSQHAIEQITNGSKSVLYTTGGKIQNNQWYEIKMVFAEGAAKFYLNNALLFEMPAPTGPVTASISKDLQANDLILKLVNSGSKEIKANIDIAGYHFKEMAKVVKLAGAASARNSITAANLISPVEESMEIENNFEYTLPANSFQVIRISMNNFTSDNKELKNMKGLQGIKIKPNPTNDKAEITFKQPVSEDFTMMLFDIKGQQIMRKRIAPDEHIFVQKGNLPSGNYIVELKNEHQIYTEKIVFN